MESRKVMKKVKAKVLENFHNAAHFRPVSMLDGFDNEPSIIWANPVLCLKESYKPTVNLAQQRAIMDERVANELRGMGEMSINPKEYSESMAYGEQYTADESRRETIRKAWTKK